MSTRNRVGHDRRRAHSLECVLQALRKVQPADLADVAHAAGFSTETTLQRLRELIAEGKVVSLPTLRKSGHITPNYKEVSCTDTES